MTHDHDSSIATGRTPEQFGVQAWSQGEIYPAVIYLRERYSDTGEFRSASHVLSLDGLEEDYATHEDAEEVARALLGSPFLRAQWSQGREFDTAEARYESETAGEWQERMSRGAVEVGEALGGAKNIAAEIAEAIRTGGNSL